MKIFFQVILLSFIVAACAPVFKKDYYLSFEKVVGISSVKMIDKKSVEHSLNRNNYTISLRLDEKSGLRVYINSKDINAIPLTINGRPVGGVSEDNQCGLFSEPYPQDNVSEQGVIVFAWYITRSGCEIDKLRGRDLILSFVVTDKSNRILSIENIPFEIKKKGIRVILDSI